MQTKPNYSPIEMMVGGCMLAAGAAFVNAGFLVSSGTSVSHLTGDISRMATDLYHPGQLLPVLIAVIGFTCGATLSGYFLHHPVLEISVPYGRMVAFIGCLFLLAYFNLSENRLLAFFLAAGGCGMQNALASRYRGVVLRTTHLTGLFTDLGISLGMKLKGHVVESWKVLTSGVIICSFFVGAAAGGFASLRWQNHWLLFSGLAYVAAGFFLYLRRITRLGNGQSDGLR